MIHLDVLTHLHMTWPIDGCPDFKMISINILLFYYLLLDDLTFLEIMVDLSWSTYRWSDLLMVDLTWPTYRWPDLLMVDLT